MAKRSAKELAAAKARAAANASKKGGGSSTSKDTKKSQKNEEAQIKKYYGEKTTDTEQLAATKAARLQEDLAAIMRDSGIAQTRATQDYLRNIGNIQANKAADVSDIDEYVKTNTGRTQEDLDTSLLKEQRRYQIQYDQTNQDLADRGMTFSERKPEQIINQQTAQNTADINVVANRSFQDIARYEAAKNRDIELKYGQATAETEAAKQKTMEDVLNAQADAQQKIQRGQEDIVFGKATDIRDINYKQAGSLQDTADKYAEEANKQQINFTNNQVLGNNGTKTA